MAGDIKGITIEFRGETTKLRKALNDVKSQTRGIDTQLRAVNKSLKFNPQNTELLAQKQKLLGDRIKETKTSLNDFKKIQSELDSKGVDKTSKEYMEVRRNIIEAESQLKHFNGELQKTKIASSGLNQLGNKFKDLGGKFTNAGQKLSGMSKTAAVVAAGMGALAWRAGSTADDFNTLAKTSGIAASQLQVYSRVSELVDVSVEDIAKAQTKLKKSMLTAMQGSKTAALAFKQLGVSITDSSGHMRNQDIVFQELLKSLGSMKNETERDALAMQIFGKSATQLNPMIEDMGKTYKSVSDTLKANKLDFVDQATLNRANEFKDKIDLLKAGFGAAADKIGSKLAETLLPVMERLTPLILDILGKISETDGKKLAIIGGIATSLAAAAPALMIFGRVFDGIGKSMQLVSKILPGLGGGFGKLFGILGKHPIMLVVGALLMLSGLLYKSGVDSNQLTAKFQEITTKIVEKLPMFIQMLTNFITTALPQIISIALTLLLAIVQAIPQILPPLLDGIIVLINGIITMLPTLIPILLTAAIQLFMAIVQAIPEIATALIKALPLIVSSFVIGLASQLPAVWTQIKNSAWQGFEQLRAIVTQQFKKVTDAILSPMRWASKKWHEIIKGFSKFTAGIPNIKMPHFAVSPAGWTMKKLLEGVVPKLSIAWYQQGGIFDKPSLIGVGEAGREAVVPLDRNTGWIDLLAEKINGKNSSQPTIVNYITFKEASKNNIDELVRILDKELGRRAANR